ncbi:hypothetical protein ACF3M1_02580 [Luteimonas sp. WGS1318]|uniref:hypothetical protein n=1 Tax=Luteimonas sp. WGS1318 TaxID=3366815 RepID=UPI00372D7081
MRHVTSIACVGLALLSAGIANAASPRVTPVACDTCTSEDAFRQAALASGQGRVLVYNLPANTLSSWRRTRADASEPTLVEVESDPAAVRELDAAHHVYKAAGGTLRPVVAVQVSALGVHAFIAERTAHDLVADVNMQGMLASAAGDEHLIARTADPALVEALRPLWWARASDLGLRAQSALVYRVTFHDGSTAEFENAPGTSIARYRVGSAIAADGRALADADSGDARQTGTRE